MNTTSRFDWKMLTKEFVEGPFKTVSEYVLFNIDRKKEFGEDRPSKISIEKASARYEWIMLKKKREMRAYDRVVDGAVNKRVEGYIEELAKQKITLNQAILKLIVDAANNPGNIQMKADISDLVNDLKRGMGERTKEQDIQPAQFNLQQNTIDAGDSFRKQLEEADSKDRVKLIKFSDAAIEEIEDTIPEDDLAFLEE